MAGSVVTVTSIATVYCLSAGIKHLPYVRAAMIGVSSNWYMIGIHFGLKPNILDKIQSENRRDTDRCLTAMIAEWLVNSISPPTWRKVVIAIASKVGGDNPSEAQRIVEQHQGK